LSVENKNTMVSKTVSKKIIFIVILSRIRNILI